MGCFSCSSLLLILFLSVIVRNSTASSLPIFGPTDILASSNPLSSVVLPPVVRPRTSLPPHALLPAVSRRQFEEIPQLSQEKEPSCAELKIMWRKMRRIARQMEITNEIPKLQDPFMASAYRYKPSKYPDANPYTTVKSSSISKVFQKPNDRGLQNLQSSLDLNSPNFGKIIRDTDEHHLYYNSVNNKQPVNSGNVGGGRPVHIGFDNFEDDTRFPKANFKSRGRVPGRFSNVPLSEESLGVYGTVVHTPEEKARFRARSRRPPETGYKTRGWVGVMDSGNVGRVPFRALKPHGQYHYGSVVTHTTGKAPGSDSDRFAYRSHPMGGFAEFPTEIGQRTSSGSARVERIDKIAAAGRLKNSCLRLQNKTCKTDVDCYCIGNPKLFCGGNRCRPRYKAQKYLKPAKWGKSWFVDPYEEDYIGYGFKHDPVWPEPF